MRNKKQLPRAKAWVPAKRIKKLYDDTDKTVENNNGTVQKNAHLC